jgi:O-antigen/teichoic acid export membrane protein
MVTELGSDAPTMARGALANVTGALLTTGFSFVLSFIITHSVSVGRFGLFSIASTVILLAQVPAVLGLDTGAVRFVALGASADDEGAVRSAVQTALLAAALTSAVLAIVIAIEAPYIATNFFHKPRASEVLAITSWSLPGLVLTRVVIGALQGLGVMTYSAWLNPIRAMVNILTAIPLLAIGFDIHGLAVASVITAWTTLGIAIGFLFRVHPTVFTPCREDWSFRRMLRFSAPQTLTTMLLYTILWTDTLVLGRLRAAADVAIYTIVQRLLSPAQTISTATGQMFAPRVAAEDARGNLGGLSVMLKRLTYWNLALSIPVFVVLLLLPGPLLSIFGTSYERGAAALAILAAGQLVNAATGPLGQVINMSGRPYITMVNNGVVATLNIAGCLILVPQYGITGAACSTTASITAVNLIKLVQVRLIFGINPFRFQMLRAVGVAVLSAAIVSPIAFLPPWPSDALMATVATPLILSVYAFLFWTIAAGTTERREFARRMNALLSRRTGNPPAGSELAES